ncbi:MAG: alpha-1,2-fucosyltransferase [Flavobacterium sp.]|nr:alpha-1,2-fucosyltransferase [Flavobacterium sp.]
MEQSYLHFDASFFKQSYNKYCIGYFQSYKYFQSIGLIIKSDFGFKNPIDTDCEPLLRKICETNSVCIHIRRGDYVNNSNYANTAMDYYQKAIDILVKKEKDLKLFLFSDDIKWCRENVTFSKHINFVSEEFAGHKAKNHFYLMRSCKHFIISNSTFAWWAAYLAANENKLVIAPKKWVMNQSLIIKDLIPDSWTTL